MSNRLYNKETVKKPFWYKVPFVLEWGEWDVWRDQTKKDYPIQYFFREDVSFFFYSLRKDLENLKYKISCFFFPRHPELRKAVPRTWSDISNLVVELNFAMILSFKKEADESWVDWDGAEAHRKFKDWLDSAAVWIQEGRPNLEKQKSNAYPPHPLPEHLKNKSYDELYSEVNRLEKLIDDTDSNIIKQMVDYREYMWT
jgi:hypothetical protein